MKDITVLLIILLSLISEFCFGQTNQSDRYESFLLKLDSVLAESDKYANIKEDKIAQLKKRYLHTTNSEEVYWLNKMLYDEYVVFNADSAMKYVYKNLHIAEKLKKTEWLITWKINQSFLLSATGLLKESDDILKEINPEEMSQQLKAEYYRQLIYLYSRFGRYKGKLKGSDEIYQKREKDYRDSAFLISTPNDPYYLWYKGWKYMDTPKVDEVREELLQVVSKSNMQNRIDALNAYTLAFLSQRVGKEEDYIKYLVYSAIADIRSVNKDIASIEKLANILYELGDIDRAYTYLNYCLKNAQLYPNRVRAMGILDAQERLFKAFQQRNAKQERGLGIFLVIVSMLSIILIVAVGYIYIQMKKLATSRVRLNEANTSLNQYVEQLSMTHVELAKVNTELKAVNDRLENTNEELRESNYLKEEYIGYIFYICSNYISKLDDFRKDISRKMKTKLFDEVRKQVDSPIIANSELKEFYHTFDTIFLHVYPNFVDDFNSLLLPEKRIVLKEGELLNTELRIYALVRLGFNDSVKIADFLHCSPQTVYNSRLKTRNKAIIPKDGFADTVKALGKKKNK